MLLEPIAGSGAGSSTFTGLTDAPDSYAGQKGKLVRVNTAEDGLVIE